ncbi:MAG: radical SAM family heme chaperone HemW [Bacteroidia bacterium]|nr:radical SAM family heme chaperone HemW [Bacteroidia bacterium]
MIYLHVPFCKSFCTYCDFYSETVCKGREAGMMAAYADGVCREIDARRQEIENTRSLNTLYAGGGTPSVLPLALLRKIVDHIGGAPFEEFTVEVNPEDIVGSGLEYVRALKSLGVTRISMGVQSLDDEMLRWMNRRHTAERAREAFGLLREGGMDNVSVDVIFGISHLSDASLDATMDGVLEMAPEHISAYQLSIEEGSALAEMLADGRYSEAGEELCRRQYEHICKRLRDAGYHHYEISNWAKSGFEAKHNSAYWTRHPYVGLGPGAHSLRIDGDVQVRSWNSQVLSGWISESETLSAEEIREEEMMLGLRTDKGVNGLVIPESDWFIADSIIADIVSKI